MKFYLLLAAMFIGMAGAFYWYYSTTQAKIEILLQNNAIYEHSLQESQETIEYLRSVYNHAADTIASINKDMNAIRQENNELNRRVAELNLSDMARRNPSELEDSVNSDFRRLNRCFEILAGAELTEEERNAQMESGSNNLCPWIFGINP